MFCYVVFALALVAACSGDDPSKPILENELRLLDQLMTDIEARINATASAQVSALTNASLACWSLHLGNFASQVETQYRSGLLAFRNLLSDKWLQADGMTQAQLDALQDELADTGKDGLMVRQANLLQMFQSSVTDIMSTLSQSTSFTCT